MSKIYQGAVELIGNTPLVEVTNLEKKQELKARVLVKLEYLNPAGSVKDRIAKAMLEDAEQKGKLKEGSVIIEPTSGNTGIGLAAIAASKGYRVILTMPETMSVERRNILKAYGAEIVLTQGVKGMKGAIERARELAAEIPNSFIPGQFENPANPEAHRKTTGPEIWRDTDGKVDFFVAGVGTGGTVSGTGEYLKSQNPDVKIVAVEPADSPVLAGGKPGPHKIQGIGAGFVPQTLNTKIYDDIFEVQNDDAFAAAKLIAKHEGILVGISVQHSTPHWNWRRSRKMPERRSWLCCRTAATGIIPPHCSQTKGNTAQRASGDFARHLLANFPSYFTKMLVNTSSIHSAFCFI